MILISWIGAKAIVASGNNAALGMTTGDLTALFSYATQILMSLMMLSMIFAMLTISLASGRRIAEILEEKTDISNPANPEMIVRMVLSILKTWILFMLQKRIKECLITSIFRLRRAKRSVLSAVRVPLNRALCS